MRKGFNAEREGGISLSEGRGTDRRERSTLTALKRSKERRTNENLAGCGRPNSSSTRQNRQAKTPKNLREKKTGGGERGGFVKNSHKLIVV